MIFFLNEDLVEGYKTEPCNCCQKKCQKRQEILLSIRDHGLKFLKVSSLQLLSWQFLATNRGRKQLKKTLKHFVLYQYTICVIGNKFEPGS